MEVDANSGQLISKLYSVSYGDLNGKKIQERVDISIHIADSGFPGSSAGWSFAYRKWGHKRLLCPGAPQGLAQFH